jgi:RimJ/RimL family protein N-acetyltransferase
LTALPPVPPLCGTLVHLEPLSLHHAADLGEAAEEDRSSYGFTFVPSRQEVADYIGAHLDRQARCEMLPFVQVRQRDGRAVGCTAYVDFRPMPDGDGLAAVMVGWTWLSASAQTSGINRESKLLLLTHAFEQLGVVRVDFSTDARNERSRRALAGLGATFEGVLRNWSRSHARGEEGELRDSAIFSVVAAEWPTVKAVLASRVNTIAPTP